MRKSLYILGRLSDEDVEWMLAFGQRHPVAPGDVLIRQGQPVEDLYLILEGIFAVTDDRRGGHELARVGGGEIVGEMSFIDANPPSATVTAVEDGLVLALSRKLLQQRLDQDTAFGSRFYFALAVFLSDRLRATEGKLYRGDDSVQAGEDAIDEDELDPNVLDTVHLAGARFKHMLDRLKHS
jgi:CRP/FNR family cyclic AMP-dependent transcriptional regulator